MSVLAPPPVRPSTGDRPTSAVGRRGRLATVTVMLVSFVAMSVLQTKSQAWHYRLIQNTESVAKLSNLDSFSLALLLGGFRGPLVMMLWSTSESQKQSKDLEDFDSKIELIRLLQPEFDSVHIFQMWNKAYNISVQMVNNSDKYATIVDALEYGYKQDKQHPDDLNILSSIGRIFFAKLGDSQEQEYYTRRVTRESFPEVRMTIPADRLKDLDGALAHAGIADARSRAGLVAQAKQGGAITVDKLTFDAVHREINGAGVSFTAVMPQTKSDTGRRIRLDPILNLDGTLTAEAAASPVLSYLKQFEPFPYGVSPMAIGCAYFKRCQILKDTEHQTSLEQSDLVVDNRPAINAENWGEKEWGWGRESEMAALGKEIPPSANYSDKRDRCEIPTASVSPNAAVVDRVAAEEAIYRYRLVPKIAKVAEAEFRRHAGNYPEAENKFRYNASQMNAMSHACVADGNYLSAMLLPENDARRKALLSEAVTNYREAMVQWEAIALKHEMPDQLIAQMLPQHVAVEDAVNELYSQSLKAIASSPRAPAPLDVWVARFSKYLNDHPQMDMHHDDRLQTERYFTRAFDRLAELGAAPPWPG